MRQHNLAKKTYLPTYQPTYLPPLFSNWDELQTAFDPPNPLPPPLPSFRKTMLRFFRIYFRIYRFSPEIRDQIIIPKTNNFLGSEMRGGIMYL